MGNSENQPLAGWYRSKNGSDVERFWDGSDWTDKFRVVNGSDAEVFGGKKSPKVLRNIFQNNIFFISISALLAIVLIALSIIKFSPSPSGQIIAEPSVVPTNSLVPEFESSSNSLPIEVCKLADQRITKLEDRNVGFPMTTDFLPRSGQINLIVVPVDFPDAEGTESPSEFITEQIEQMNEWAKFTTNNQMSFSIQTTENWIRAPKPSATYEIAKGSPNQMNVTQDIQNQMTQDLITATGNTFDFGNVQGIIFLFPPNIQGLENDLSAKGETFITPQGSKQLFVRGGGMAQYRITNNQFSPRFWQFWIHEILHAQGFPLHAPGNGFNTGISQNTFGLSAVLGGWESLLAGWMPGESVYCSDLAGEQSINLKLNPLESDSDGYKMGMVKINDHEVVVIESRRPTGFSSGWDSADQGLLVYSVDTSLDNDRTGECCGDNGNDPNWSKWAFYLRPDGASAASGSYDPSEYKKLFVKEGQTLTYKGIKIQNVYSGKQDFVKITKQ